MYCTVLESTGNNYKNANVVSQQNHPQISPRMLNVFTTVIDNLNQQEAKFYKGRQRMVIATVMSVLFAKYVFGINRSKKVFGVEKYRL